MTTNKLTIDDFPPELIERLAARCLELAGMEVPQHLWSDERYKAESARQKNDLRISRLLNQPNKDSGK